MYTPSIDGGSDLPSYTPSLASRLSFARTRSPVEHAFHLPDSHDVPWLTLRVSSNVASPHLLPSFYEGQTIIGGVDLDLKKVNHIQSISVHLAGQIVSVNANPVVFLQVTRPLWSRDMGDPRQSDSTHRPSKHNGKLQGQFHWDFSFTLPSTCSISVKPRESPRTLPLPPSLSERGAAQYISYELYVLIRRGALRVDSKLSTQFGYSPRIRPDPPSYLRQISYRDKKPLVGPDRDPKGWQVVPLRIVGKMGARSVDASCTFALAAPLSYCRGLSIPCRLTFTSTDSSVLDLLAVATSPDVRLLRDVSYGEVHGPMKTHPKQTFTSSTTEISSAVWWRRPGVAACDPNSHTRRLEGEVHLPKDLQPSFEFGPFSLKYTVVISPFNLPDYEPSDHKPLLMQNVSIATFPPVGPVPRVYSKPNFGNLRRKPLTYGLYTNDALA